jgi:endonuclease/exonuclease/phosphatase family metal-dependent hydrolase
MRVLSWNLFHGRARPPAGRSLLAEFAEALAGWEWNVALLQEVPPWWPPELARAAGAEQRTALTSRNWPLFLRRALARRWPDLMKSHGGGANAILARGRLEEHAVRRVRLTPERRLVHAVRLAHGGPWVANLHLSAHHPPRAEEDLRRAAAALAGWAPEGPAVLGGDFNLRDPGVPGFERVAQRDVDAILIRDLHAVGPADVLERGPLSDHPPLAVTLA